MTDPIITAHTTIERPKICSTCRHWQSPPEKTSGICRRNAPITIAVVTPAKMAESGMILKTVWPSTGPQDYCGEHGLPFDAQYAEGA